MNHHGRRLGYEALRLFIPHRCVFCGVITELAGFCPGCRADLPINDCCCTACACPLVDPAGLCASCQRRRMPLVGVLAPLRYEFPVDAGLKALKFRAQMHYLPAFAGLLIEACERLPADIDALIAMPMHWRRRASRGFNQAEELARPLARHLGLPMLGSVRRRRHTRSQSGLDARARKQNLKGAFRAGQRIQARHVLVVDDIMTTGESMKRLAIEVRRAGAGKVSAIVVARAGGSAPARRGQSD